MCFYGIPGLQIWDGVQSCFLIQFRSRKRGFSKLIQLEIEWFVVPQEFI